MINPELWNIRAHDAKFALSFITSKKNVGTQAIYLDYRSSRVHLCQCHLLHNLHLEKIYIGEKEDD